MFETLSVYLAFPIVRYAIIVGTLIALCSSLLGVVLVLRRFSFIGDGLSHVAFTAMAVAGIAGLTNDMLVVLPVTILCAIILLRTSQNTKINGDAMVAMISVGSLALGYLGINLFSESANVSGDVCTVLFGATKILTLTEKDVYICAGMSIVVIVLFVLCYNKIFAITFDENFSKAVGAKVTRYNTVIAIVIASIIVLAMNLVGSLLVSALIIFPALSAMRLFKSYKSVTISSAIISVVCALTGIIVSIFIGTPVGSTIVGIDIVAFAICYTIGKIVRA